MCSHCRFTYIHDGSFLWDYIGCVAGACERKCSFFTEMGMKIVTELFRSINFSRNPE